MFGASLESLALAVLVALIAGEFVISRLLGRPAYDAASTETNLGIATGWLISGSATGALTGLCIALGNQLAILHPGHDVAAYALLFVAGDFLYYIWHRANHKFGWLWATHSVHHSAMRLNFLAALRQGWTDILGGTFFFFAPLGLLGFPPSMCLTYFLALQIWQMFVHNEWTDRLGVLEWVMVTPSNHRVHHSLRTEHVDRNYGGMFILWDRLFGTYALEGERIGQFGYDGGPPPDAGLLTQVFWGWAPIVRATRARVAALLRR